VPEPDATLPTSGIVRQRRLSDQVADAIRDDILARELQPGDRLPS